MKSIAICIGLVGNIQVVSIDNIKHFLKKHIACEGYQSGNKNTNTEPENVEGANSNSTIPPEILANKILGPICSKKEKNIVIDCELDGEDVVVTEKSNSGKIWDTERYTLGGVLGSTEKASSVAYDNQGNILHWSWFSNDKCYRSDNLPSERFSLYEPTCTYAYVWKGHECNVVKRVCSPTLILEYEEGVL